MIVIKENSTGNIVHVYQETDVVYLTEQRLQACNEWFVEITSDTHTMEKGVDESTITGDYYTPILTAEEARVIRGRKLTETDWTASTDITMTAEMTSYRTALRDIPAQADFPNIINWPTKPEA